MSGIFEWSDGENISGIEFDAENEGIEERTNGYQSEESESDGDTDQLQYDEEIDGDASDYIDECKVNISHFDLIKKLGTGAYGTVFLSKKNCGLDAGKIYAVKVIQKDKVVVNVKTIRHMRAERKVLEILRGAPYIPKLYYAFQTVDKLFLVIDYVPGGELFTLLQKGSLTESLVRFYIAELVVALENIHAEGIAYRDIKLENILIDAEGHIKLVDFGLCKKMAHRGRSKSMCGTVEYMAPEVVTGVGHNAAADWWALGVLAFELLTSSTPFGSPHDQDGSSNQDDIMQRIAHQHPILPSDISKEMHHFIKKLLIKDATRRLGGGENSAEDIKRHPVFRGMDWEKLGKKQVPSPYVPTINHPLDIQHFSEDFTNDPPTYEPSEIPNDTFLTFKGYSYIAPELNPTPYNYLLWEVNNNPDPDSEFNRKYRFASNTPLGYGELSVCMKCTDVSKNTVYAVKIYRREDRSDNEIDVLRKAESLPGIVKLVEVITDLKFTYLVMELVEGVDLLQHLSRKSSKTRVAFNAFKALRTIIERLHSIGYAHGRICFKNFRYIERKSEFRLIGLGHAMPIRNANGKKIDYWSMGVCIYTVMCGRPPFDLSSIEISKKIATNDFDNSSEQWRSLHKDIKVFIDQLLSLPTCTENNLKVLRDSSMNIDKYSQKQIEDNKNIIVIRSKVHIENELIPALNGMAIITNGNCPDDVDMNPAKLARNNKNKHSESQTNNEKVNGNVKKAPKTAKRPAELISNSSKKQKIKNEPSTPNAEKPVDKWARSLRKQNPKIYTETLKQKLRRSPSPPAKDITIPKRQADVLKLKDKIKTDKKDKKDRNKGEEKKVQTSKQESTVLESQKHSVAPNQPNTQLQQLNQPSTSAVQTHKDMAVQTSYVYIMLPRRKKAKPYYCFERIDYQ